MKFRPTFWLKDSRQRTTSIIAAIYFDRTRLRFATGLTVSPANWSLKRQRVKAGDTLAAVINDRLDEIAIDLGRIVMELDKAGNLTPESVKARYAALDRSGGKGNAPIDLLKAYQHYIDQSDFTPGTKKNHGKAKNHLRNFSEVYGLSLSFERLDSLFWDKFARYLLTVQNLTNDSAWNVVKSIKAFLADAIEKGHTAAEDFRKVTRKSLPSGETSDKPYLTADELERVRQLDLSGNPRLDRVRDLFVFLCYTGIRFGDSQQLHPENVEGDRLRIVTGKNRKSVSVPLLEPARAILDKYSGTLPKISNQKANAYLPDILKEAKIVTPIQVVTYSGTERREKVRPKYEAVGMHGAKRTFVSLTRQRGVSVEALMKATGNTRATLDRYILRTENEALSEITEAWK